MLTPADPDNFYGWEKLYTEKMCEAYKKDFSYQGLSQKMGKTNA